MLDFIESELKKANASLSEFREIAYRLLGNQAIYRKQSNSEAMDYDLFVRLQDLIEEYLGVLGFRVVHYEQMQYVACFPPGSDIPGVRSDDDVQAHYYRNLKRNEKIVLIVARYLFEEKLREGQLSEDGVAYVDLEKFHHTFAMVSKQPLDKESERDELLRFLKGLRVVQFNDLSVQDALVGFRNTILCYSMDSVIQKVQEEIGADEEDEDIESQPGEGLFLEMTDEENME